MKLKFDVIHLNGYHLRLILFYGVQRKRTRYKLDRPDNDAAQLPHLARQRRIGALVPQQRK